VAHLHFGVTESVAAVWFLWASSDVSFVLDCYECVG